MPQCTDVLKSCDTLSVQSVRPVNTVAMRKLLLCDILGVFPGGMRSLQLGRQNYAHVQGVVFTQENTSGFIVGGPQPNDKVLD